LRCLNCWVYFIATLSHCISSNALYKETYNYRRTYKCMGVEPEICEPLEIEQSNKQDLQISVDASFLSWDLAEVQLNSYAKAKGFSLHRKRVEFNNNGEGRQRTFECTHSGKCVSNQVVDLSQQRNRSSGKISCPWHINLSKPKESAVVIITSIIGEHNHQLQSDIRLYAPKYRKLSSEILEKIEFYVTKGKIGSKQMLPLLTSEFPDYIIHKRDLYNAVQKVRRPLNQHQGEAQEFVNYLLYLKHQEPGCIVNFRVRHYSYMNSLPTSQMPSVVESLFLQQIAGSLLYRAQLRPIEDILELQENLQLDYDNGFLENQLDRPQNSIIALIKDIDLSDIIEIWKLICLSSVYKHYIVLLCDGGYLCTCMTIINRGIICSHFFQVMMNTKAAKFHIGLVARRWYYDDQQDIRLEDLQLQSIEISTMFQQTATNIAVPDFHIIEKIRDTNMYIVKNQQAANKKARYANGFGRMKKALNIALDLGCKEKLIYVISSFINQKKSAIENINNKNIQLGESQQIIVIDPLVVKHRGRPPIKRLKSSSETPSNIDLNSYIIDNNANELCHKGKRKYICNLCGG
ncbi:22931_t:CDS:2, partial [Cetraspora pellucida]